MADVSARDLHDGDAMEYFLGFTTLALTAALISVIVVLARRNRAFEEQRLSLAKTNADLEQFHEAWEAHAESEERATTRARDMETRAKNLEAAVVMRTSELLACQQERDQYHDEMTELMTRVRIVDSRLKTTVNSLEDSNSQREASRQQLDDVLDKYNEVENLAAIRHGRATELEQKYAALIDLDAEIERRKLDVADLDKKRRELREIEEDLFFTDVGIYKPHFDWTDSAKFKLALEAHYDRHKAFVKADKATTLDMSLGVLDLIRKEGKKLSKDLSKLAVRAFNAECEAAIGKVRWNNFNVMEKRINKAYDAINKLVSRWRMSITNEYRQLWIEELILTHEYKEQLEREREEQRRINEQMREEAKVQRELEAAQKEAAEAEAKTARAIAEVRAAMEQARADEVGGLTSKLAELEAALAEAHARGERAKSMAELTRVGHVYIISNIGSFGEDVYKIGMTRREDPQERIKELSDASVPFFFDVHGMVFSEDAPKLERALHAAFSSRRVNLVNQRKEFFRVSLDEIVAHCRALGQELELTLAAEAREYRETLALRTSKPAEMVESRGFEYAIRDEGAMSLSEGGDESDDDA